MTRRRLLLPVAAMVLHAVAAWGLASECPTALADAPAPVAVGAPGRRPAARVPRATRTLEIAIAAGAGLAADADALAAFRRAAARWEAVVADPITVTVDADLVDFGTANVIGQSRAIFVRAAYADVRAAMIADAGADEATVLGALPAAGALTVRHPAAFAFDDSVLATKANLKALGWSGLDAALGDSDVLIRLNSRFAFDYHAGDGVDPGLVDFETIAAHEIAHALGFVSQVDTVDASDGGTIGVTPLDLFRFADDDAGDPETTAQFATFPRSQEPGLEAMTDDVAGEAHMSTGRGGGDGRQASHWKDDALTGTSLGVMDPTVAAGTAVALSPADRRALDLIGWDLVTGGTSGATPTTTTTTPRPTTSTQPATTTTAVITTSTTTVDGTAPTTTTVGATLPTTTTLPARGCAPAPRADCRSVSALGARLAASQRATPARDEVRWIWGRGDATPLDAFGDPVHGRGTFRLCVYDASDGAQPLLAAAVPAGAGCGNGSCWRATRTGFVYHAPADAPGGITAIALRPGRAGRARIEVRGRGAALGLPWRPHTPPLSVQLVAETAAGSACWTSTFAMTRSDGGLLHARGPGVSRRWLRQHR